MRPLLAIVLVAGLLAVSLPAAGDANYTERNIEYILELAGYAEMPDEMIEVMVNSEKVTMPAADAVRMAAALHSRLDLRSLGENAVNGLVAAQEISIVAYDCTRLAPNTVRHNLFMPIHLQNWFHNGYADHALQCGGTYTYEWSTKMIQFFDAYPGTLILGNGVTVTFWGITFGTVNGVVVRAAP